MRPEERDSDRGSVDRPGLPNEPDVKVQRARRVRKAGDCFALNRDRVLVNFLMISLAKSNDVVVRNRVHGWYGLIGIEPEAYTVKKMKPGEGDEPGPAWFFLRSEQDCGREDALKPLDHASIMRAILWEVKEIEHLSCRIEMDCAAFLLESEGRNP